MIVHSQASPCYDEIHNNPCPVASQFNWILCSVIGCKPNFNVTARHDSTMPHNCCSCCILKYLIACILKCFLLPWTEPHCGGSPLPADGADIFCRCILMVEMERWRSGSWEDSVARSGVSTQWTHTGGKTNELAWDGSMLRLSFILVYLIITWQNFVKHIALFRLFVC